MHVDVQCRLEKNKTQQNTDKVEPGFCISPPSLSAPSPADTFHLICFLFAKLDTFDKGDIEDTARSKTSIFTGNLMVHCFIEKNPINWYLVCSHSFFAFSITSEGFILPTKIWRVGLLRGLWKISEEKHTYYVSVFQW